MVGLEIGASRIIRSDDGKGPPHGDHIPPDLVLRVARHRPCIEAREGHLRLLPAAEAYAEIVATAIRFSGGTRPDAPPFALAIPAWWGGDATGRVTSALHHEGVRVIPVNDAQAAVTKALHEGTPLHGCVAVVTAKSEYVSVTLVRSDTAPPTTLRSPAFVHEAGGAHLDRALLQHLTRGLRGHTPTPEQAQHFPPETLRQLLAQCQSVREKLSASSIETVTLALPPAEGTLRVVRSEIEELSCTLMHDITGMLSRAIADTNETVTGVLLTGGLSHTPQLSQRISADLELDVHVPENPITVAAEGAALIGKELTRRPRKQARWWHKALKQPPSTTAITDQPALPKAEERVWAADTQPDLPDSLSNHIPLAPDEPLISTQHLSMVTK